MILTHKHPYGQDIASPRSSELFSMISDDQINRFLRLQAKRRVEDEYWAYDSSSKCLDGKIFTEFIALILISHLDHKMKETALYKSYTMQQLLDKLDVLECFEDENQKLRIGELLEKQANIYETLGVALPIASC